jgi:hypothetical protein
MSHNRREEQIDFDAPLALDANSKNCLAFLSII